MSGNEAEDDVDNGKVEQVLLESDTDSDEIVVIATKKALPSKPKLPAGFTKVRYIYNNNNKPSSSTQNQLNPRAVSTTLGPTKQLPVETAKLPRNVEQSSDLLTAAMSAAGFDGGAKMGSAKIRNVTDAGTASKIISYRPPGPSRNGNSHSISTKNPMPTLQPGLTLASRVKPTIGGIHQMNLAGVPSGPHPYLSALTPNPSYVDPNAPVPVGMARPFDLVGVTPEMWQQMLANNPLYAGLVAPGGSHEVMLSQYMMDPLYLPPSYRDPRLMPSGFPHQQVAHTQFPLDAAPPPMEVDVGEDEDETGGMVHGETYDQYVPCKLALGLPHPDPIVETASLASANPPDITYNLKMPEHIGDEGMLSSLQLEAIVYACQRHETFLGDKCRAGYLIGELFIHLQPAIRLDWAPLQVMELPRKSAFVHRRCSWPLAQSAIQGLGLIVREGVGKGRTIAGIIFENWLRGRKKSIWLSVSNDLKYDAERDLSDIGATQIEVHSLSKTRYAKLNSSENGKITKGVLFATYPCLIGESQSARSECGTRMKQILKWCGKDFDGVLVFDECHRAKNLCPSAGTKPTKTGLAVLEIQRVMPKARIIYASATGASEPRNMAYMTRLGLWGKDTPFKDFFEFTSSIDRRGVGAMEMIAMDMKLRGMYMARQLSFSGVSFDIREVPLEDDYKALYDDCVDMWTFAREKFGEAADLFQADKKLLKHMWGQFWGAHQRFFKYLCLSSKVKTTVRLAKEAVKEGKCAVIGLQSTGEARTLEQLEDNNGVLNEFVSTAKAVFQSLVEKHFPAFDRRKAFEVVGMADMLEEEMEEVLDIEPDTDGIKRRPKRKGRTAVTSYKLPTMSDLDSSDDEEGKSSKPPAPPPPPPKTRTLRTRHPTTQQKSKHVSQGKKRTRKQPAQPAKKKKLHNSSSSSEEASDFVPSDSESSGGASDDTSSGSASGTSESVSDGSAFSDEDNPWVKLLEAKRQAQKVKKGRKKSRKSVEMDEDVKKEEDVDHVSPQQNPKSSRELEEESKALKQQVLDKFLDLSMRLPTNTLDDLLDRLGGPDKVAEMTGRKGRVVTTSAGTVEYEARNDCDVALELLNLTEKQRFMDGEKLIAIISEAASSGISLQADRRAKNQRRRVHITLELPWSADKAIQQFGRTHRSNQVSAPEYVFLITDLAGEKRFASAVARRLESLGALTHGDRRATDSRDLSMFNIDTKYGRIAVERILRSSAGVAGRTDLAPTNYPGNYFRDAPQAMVDAGFLTKSPGEASYHMDKDCFTMGKFLNRILGMKVDMQNSMFDYFARTMDYLVDMAKREGRFEMGILELGFGGSDVVPEKKMSFVGKTPWSSTPTHLYSILVERGLSFDDAKEILNEFDDKSSGFYLSNQTMFGKNTVCLAVLKGGQNIGGSGRNSGAALNKRLFCIYRPNSGQQLRLDTFEEIKRKGRLANVEEARQVWEAMYDSMSRRCLHAYWGGNCKNTKTGGTCDFGLRRRTYAVLSGSILSVWTELGSVLYRGGSSSATGQMRKVQNVRVKFKNNARIMGIIIPNSQVKDLVALIKENSQESKEETLLQVERLSDSSSDDEVKADDQDNRNSREKEED